jgi:hypothetical protein
MSRTPPSMRRRTLVVLADCLERSADDRPRGWPRVRFGVGPRLAGESGTGQTVPTVPEQPAKRDAALRRLKGRRLPAFGVHRHAVARYGAPDR